MTAVSSPLFVCGDYLLYCKNVSFKVSRALFLPGWEFPQTFDLEFFSENLVEEYGKDTIVCYEGEPSCTLSLKFFPEEEK